MLNAYVPSLNIAAGRLLSGVLILSLDHPIVLALILVGLAGASVAMLFDAVTGRP